jgi:acyl transferase domain-containing protein
MFASSQTHIILSRYAMQLGGLSVVVDTACSSSSAAIYQGCRALINGDCNAALVGGVNVITSPDVSTFISRLCYLSFLSALK